MEPSGPTDAVLGHLMGEGDGRADFDPTRTGNPNPPGDAAEVAANGNVGAHANGAPEPEPQAAAPPLDSPFDSQGPASDGQPEADTSGQALPEAGEGDLTEQAPSDGGTSGGSRPRHHLLRHTLPPELSGLNCVHHFGVDGVAPALRLVQTMSQRELQQAFEKVYNVKSSSNNNNWLRKKLVEALVPRESSNDPEVDSILEELASRSGARKRQKEWTSAASGGVDGWKGHHMPPQLNPYAPYPTAALAAAQAAQAAATATAAPTNQRKSSKVRPSPTDADAGYTGEDWGAPVEEVTAAGRKKRRAAAGVAAATAAVLRDPALEEIEKADLRRAAMGDFERRWGTGNPQGGYGGRGGRGGHQSGRARAERDAAGQQDMAQTLQNLTHLLSIAVQQGKLAPSMAGGWSGASGAPGGLGALGALAQAMQTPYAQQPDYGTQQHFGPYGAQQPQPQQQGGSLAGALAALLQRQQGSGAPQQPHPQQQNGWVGGFGGAPLAPAPAPAPPAPAAPPPAEQQSVLARLLSAVAQDPSRTPEQLQQLRAIAAQASAGAPAPAPAPGPPAAADPQRAAAAATLQQVLAARIAQMRSTGADGQAPAGDLPRQGSSDAPAPAATTAGPSGGTSIPGSNYPVDTMLMQLLQQQQQAQRAAAAAAAPPLDEPETKES